MTMSEGKSSSKGLKICCAVTTIFLVVFIVVAVTLFFTVLKPKQPEVIAHPTKLENVQIQTFPFSLNATLGLVVTIENPNYGSFKYKNSTAYINYHDTTIAEVPIEHEIVPARGKLNVTTYANLTGDKLVASPYFWNDVAAGRLNFTSMAALHGKVSVLKILKMGATVFITCDISVLIQTQDVESKCYTKFKL